MGRGGLPISGRKCVVYVASCKFTRRPKKKRRYALKSSKYVSCDVDGLNGRYVLEALQPASYVGRAFLLFATFARHLVLTGRLYRTYSALVQVLGSRCCRKTLPRVRGAGEDPGPPAPSSCVTLVPALGRGGGDGRPTGT